MSPHRELLFEGNEISDAGHQGDLSAEDEIARAKARVYTPAGNKRRRPSSKSSLQVGLGEGRAFGACVQLQNPGLTNVAGSDAFGKALAHAPL